MKIRLDEIVFIINPNAGKKNPDKIIDSLLSVDKQINYFVSESQEALARFFQSDIGKYKVAVICGGDGTVNSTLKYYKIKDLIFAVLPNGSGDGFARELGFKKDIHILLNQIQNGEIQEVDLVQVNDELSCNVIGLGIDSYVAEQFDKSNKRGLVSYVIETVKAFINYKPIQVKLSAEKAEINGVYMMVIIANTRQFGNNALIAPNAKFDDGLLDVVLVKPIPLYVAPILVFNLFTGKLKETKYVQVIRAKKITIESNSTSYHIDGEPRKMDKPLDIEVKNTINFIKTQESE